MFMILDKNCSSIFNVYYASVRHSSVSVSVSVSVICETNKSQFFIMQTKLCLRFEWGRKNFSFTPKKNVINARNNFNA